MAQNTGNQLGGSGCGGGVVGTKAVLTADQEDDIFMIPLPRKWLAEEATRATRRGRRGDNGLAASWAKVFAT